MEVRQTARFGSLAGAILESGARCRAGRLPRLPRDRFMNRRISGECCDSTKDSLVLLRC